MEAVQFFLDECSASEYADLAVHRLCGVQINRIPCSLLSPSVCMACVQEEEIAFDSAFSKLRMTGTGAQDPLPDVQRCVDPLVARTRGGLCSFRIAFMANGLRCCCILGRYGAGSDDGTLEPIVAISGTRGERFILELDVAMTCSVLVS